METETKELEKKLVYTRKNIYEDADAAQKKDIFDFAEGYKAFLNAAKTERESVERAIELAEAAGFRKMHIPLQIPRFGLITLSKE